MEFFICPNCNAKIPDRRPIMCSCGAIIELNMDVILVDPKEDIKGIPKNVSDWLNLDKGENDATSENKRTN